MKFMLTYKFDPQTRDETIARFQSTGGETPLGVQLVSRWTSADLNGGFAILESYDIKALVEFTLDWSDLMELEIVPLIDDDDVREVLTRREARRQREAQR